MVQRMAITNLQTLYDKHEPFRDAAVEYAQAFIGSTSPKFAREWLESGNGTADGARTAENSVREVAAMPDAEAGEGKIDFDIKRYADAFNRTDRHGTTRGYEELHDCMWRLYMRGHEDAVQAAVGTRRAAGGEPAQNPDELDSREKLEAEIHRHFSDDYTDFFDATDMYKLTLGWLDRQAAITEQECIDTRINFAERVRFGNKIAELKEDRRKQAETISRLSSENDDYREEVDRLKRENLNLAHDLGECMADRERYRELFGKALDFADEIITLGLDIDEGLA